MAGEVIGKGLSDGATFGQSITEKVSLYGVTPVVQQTGFVTLTSATSTATDSPILVAVNSIKTALDNFGLTAT